ncbi:hook-length control protein FliK [Desulfacinum hydrothermale DSM 13146]|uniref:Hook-length control protein FliK n=1 Tax=Desulfacinum hydrothermale DSM 13146 TaxID=1121390 RepID=A0A1W1X6A0_9BACT|nr:flagellar hook-length control protein FliK [Desulfacinum hydrothermale]SMC19248.1 hook-length control protein FliK [Desulfacinum hydrothermale DSM 13146]
MLPLSINVSQLLGEFLSRERERLGRKVLSSEFQQDLAAEMNLFLGKAEETPWGESTGPGAPWIPEGTELTQSVQVPRNMPITLDGQALDERRWQADAKREVDENLLMADPLLLQKVLAQLHVPAETRMEVASRTGDEGTVSLRDLAEILKKAQEDAHKRLPSPAAVVPAVGVRRLLENVQWSGGDGALSRDWAQAAAAGDSNLEQVADLISKILHSAQSTRSKELAASAQDATTDSPQASDTKTVSGSQAEPGVGATPAWSGFAAVRHSDRQEVEDREGESPLFTDEKKELSDSLTDALAPAPRKAEEATRKEDKRGAQQGTHDRALRDGPRPEFQVLEEAAAPVRPDPLGTQIFTDARLSDSGPSRPGPGVQNATVDLGHFELQKAPTPEQNTLNAGTSETTTDQKPLSRPAAMPLETYSREAADGSMPDFRFSDSRENTPADPQIRTPFSNHAHQAPEQTRVDMPDPFIPDAVPPRPEVQAQNVIQTPVHPEPQRAPAPEHNPLDAGTPTTTTDQEPLSSPVAMPLETSSREAADGSMPDFHSSDSDGNAPAAPQIRTPFSNHAHQAPEHNPLDAGTSATTTNQEPLSSPSTINLHSRLRDASESAPADSHSSDSHGNAPADPQTRTPFSGHAHQPSDQRTMASQTDAIPRAGTPSMEAGLTGTRPLEDVPAQDVPDGEESGSPRASRLRARAHGMRTPEAGSRPSPPASQGDHHSQGFSQNDPWAGEHGTREAQNPKEATQKPNSIAFSVGSTATQQAASPVSKADPQSAGFSFSEAQWPQELADLVGRMSRERRHRMTLEVEPRHLGKITLRVETHGNYVNAWIQADHPDARDLLARNTAFLQNLLSEQGLQLSQFSVDVREQNRQSDRRFEGDPAPAHGTGTAVGPNRAKPTRIGHYAAPAEATISLRA